MQLPVFRFYSECATYHPLQQLVDISEILRRFYSNSNKFLSDGGEFWF